MSVLARSYYTMIPLGLFSLGVCAFLLSASFGNYIDPGAFIAYGIFTGGIGLVVSGVLALRADSPFAGTSFTILGSFFTSVAIYNWFFAAGEKMSSADLGWTALAWGVVLLFLAISVFRLPEVPAPGKLMWVLLFVAFFFAWINGAFHVDWARMAATVCGILVAILAWLGGFVTLRMAMAEDVP